MIIVHACTTMTMVHAWSQAVWYDKAWLSLDRRAWDPQPARQDYSLQDCSHPGLYLPADRMVGNTQNAQIMIVDMSTYSFHICFAILDLVRLLGSHVRLVSDCKIMVGQWSFLPTYSCSTVSLVLSVVVERDWPHHRWAKGQNAQWRCQSDTIILVNTPRHGDPRKFIFIFSNWPSFQILHSGPHIGSKSERFRRFTQFMFVIIFLLARITSFASLGDMTYGSLQWVFQLGLVQPW